MSEDALQTFSEAVSTTWGPLRSELVDAFRSQVAQLLAAPPTQAWLAAGDDPKADVKGEYFYHLKRMTPNPRAYDTALQHRLIAICADISGVSIGVERPLRDD